MNKISAFTCKLLTNFALCLCSLVFITCRKDLKPMESEVQEQASSIDRYSSPIVRDGNGNTPQVQEPFQPGEVICVYPPGTDELKRQSYRKLIFGKRKIQKIEGCVCDPTIELIKGEGVDSLVLNDPTRTVTSSTYGVQGVVISKNLLLAQANTGTTKPFVPFNYSTRKGNVRIAVLDSGLDLGFFTSSSPRNFLLPSTLANFKPVGINNPSMISKNGYFGWNFINNNQDFRDDNFMKHGTQVTGLILSENVTSAPGIIPLKVFDSRGQATEFSVLCALKFAELAQAKIINASWGYQGAKNEALRKAVESLRSKKILVVTSAGNENLEIGSSSRHPYFPACFSSQDATSGMENVITATTAKVYTTNTSQGTRKTGKLCGQNYSVNHVDVAVSGKGDDCGILSAFSSSSSNVRLSGSSYATAVLTGIIADKYFAALKGGSVKSTGSSVKENVMKAVLAGTLKTDPVIPGVRTGKRVIQ